MNFREYENTIIGFIKNNFDYYIQQSVEPQNQFVINDYVNDSVDFDKYRNENIVFFQFNEFDYEYLSNESNIETLFLSIFISLRQDKEENLKRKQQDAASSLYNLFEATGGNFDGIVDYGIIRKVSFYDAVEGVKSLKVVQFDFELNKEK